MTFTEPLEFAEYLTGILMGSDVITSSFDRNASHSAHAYVECHHLDRTRLMSIICSAYYDFVAGDKDA